MDRILYNGTIRSLDDKNSIYEAIGIKDGKIAFLGTNQEAENFACAERIDLKERLLLPGFVDTHMHMVNYAFVENSVKLFDCKSVEDTLNCVRKRLDEQKAVPPSWLYCRGFNEEHFDVPRYPTKDEIDAVSSEIPIIMVRVCGHAAVCNSAGLKRLKRIKEFDEIKDQIDFETGLIREHAVQFYYSTLDAPAMGEVEEYIRFGMKKLNEGGFTGVQSDDLASLPGKQWRTVIQAYRHLDETKQMTLRVYEQCLFERISEGKAFVEEGFRTGQKGEFFTIGPMKLLQDGSLGARTAALREAYEGETCNRGIAIYSQEELDDLIAFYDQHQMQAAVHCIGDRAMDMVLEAIEKSPYRSENAKGRHGIVHVQITNPEILRKMQEQEVLAYIQPVFVDLDMNIVEYQIGPQRMDKVYAWKTMLDMGVHVCGGSDAPVVSFDIMDNLYFAITRRNIQGKPENGWIPSERMSVDEAVKLFTKNAAYASYTEEENGTLELGKWADLVVLEKDIYEIDSEDIKTTSVDLTIVGGNIVYER